jgi:hypothetical protein
MPFNNGRVIILWRLGRQLRRMNGMRGLEMLQGLEAQWAESIQDIASLRVSPPGSYKQIGRMFKGRKNWTRAQQVQVHQYSPIGKNHAENCLLLRWNIIFLRLINQVLSEAVPLTWEHHMIEKTCECVTLGLTGSWKGNKKRAERGYRWWVDRGDLLHPSAPNHLPGELGL